MEFAMRTNIDIDDKIMRDAMRAGGFKTRKDAVEAAYPVHPLSQGQAIQTLAGQGVLRAAGRDRKHGTGRRTDVRAIQS